MMRSMAACLVAIIAGLMLLGSTAGASAFYRRSGCCGGPIPPSYQYRTVHAHKHATRYRDLSVYRHVQRIRRVVNVTRIRPVLHLHVVTRVHHHTVFHTRNVYERATQYLPPVRSVTYSTQNYYDCSCR